MLIAFYLIVPLLANTAHLTAFLYHSLIFN